MARPNLQSRPLPPEASHRWATEIACVPGHVNMQAVKVARRKEDVAVCVVKLLPSGPAPESDSQYLLVQRPEKGLLAGTDASTPQLHVCCCSVLA